MVAQLIKKRLWGEIGSVPYVWWALVGFILTCNVLASLAFVRIMQERHSLFADFTVFWTAARSPTVYDASALTIAQMDRLPAGTNLRPFVYPPPALLLIKPLALLSYWPALIGWSLAGVLAFATASLLYGRRALVGLVSTPVAVSLIAGQMSLLTGGCLAAGVALLRTNEVASGILFGCVFAVKPQIAVLVPVALVAGRYFKALAAFTLSLAGGVLVSFAFGPHLWIEWVGALPQFAHEAATSAYARMNIALGLRFAPLGIAIAGLVFWRIESPALRLIALVCGTILCVPYMMIYELAAAGPGVAALLMRPLVKEHRSCENRESVSAEQS